MSAREDHHQGFLRLPRHRFQVLDAHVTAILQEAFASITDCVSQVSRHRFFLHTLTGIFNGLGDTSDQFGSDKGADPYIVVRCGNICKLKKRLVVRMAVPLMTKLKAAGPPQPFIHQRATDLSPGPKEAHQKHHLQKMAHPFL